MLGMELACGAATMPITELTCGVAVHNLAARSTPARRRATPAARLMIPGQSALCIVLPILTKHPHLRLQVNQRLVTPIAVQDQNSLHTELCKAVSKRLNVGVRRHKLR
jgi:hypothetical protein